MHYVNAHGTSTPYNDKFETMALKAVFGEEGAKKLAVSSSKGGTGHTLGATGGIEAVIACKALATGIIPPTINFKTADPDCDLDYTVNKAGKRNIKVRLKRLRSIHSISCGANVCVYYICIYILYVCT